MADSSSSAPRAQLWINGPRPSSTQKTFNVVNAAFEIVTRASSASSEDANAAVLAADKAQPAWESLPLRTRRQVFVRAAELVSTAEYRGRIVATLREEISSGEFFAEADVAVAQATLLDAAAMTTQLRGETTTSDLLPGATVLVERRPFGTVLAIAPFNAPVGLAMRAVATALACGNAVVLKSSDQCPRCAQMVVNLFYEAGLPPGLLSLIHVAKEDAPQIVSELIAHKRIRHINFTGSTPVGEIIAAKAAQFLKPCVLELGGKAAAVVLNDCNVEAAARGIIFGATFHSGQVCVSTERVIVQRAISSAFSKALIDIARELHAGDSPTSELSPLVTATSAERVLSLITDAKSRGASVLVGDVTRQGAVLQPHILLGVEPGWPIWEEETFGPVFGLKVVDTEEEAVELANESPYTLSGAVWTRDMDKGLRLARRIRASHVLVNSFTTAFEPALGVHGLGGATGYGRFDVENFTQRRTVVLVSP
ncbi:aldehyde dehydrogenase [Hysterangium stoloniferum]|nr:aldehyde dehydrogenase [Hysterangium stoloniferum]